MEKNIKEKRKEIRPRKQHKWKREGCCDIIRKEKKKTKRRRRKRKLCQMSKPR